MRLDKTVEAEQKRVRALIESGEYKSEFVDGFLKGAQQALAWVRVDNASAPSEAIAGPQAKANEEG